MISETAVTSTLFLCCIIKNKIFNSYKETKPFSLTETYINKENLLFDLTAFFLLNYSTSATFIVQLSLPVSKNIHLRGSTFLKFFLWLKSSFKCVSKIWLEQAKERRQLCKKRRPI